MDVDWLQLLTPRLFVVAGAIGLFGYLHGFVGAVLGEVGIVHASQWAANVSSACMSFAPGIGLASLLRNYLMRDAENAIPYKDDLSPLACRIFALAGLGAGAGYLHGLLGAALRELSFSHLAQWASDVGTGGAFLAIVCGFMAMLMHLLVAVAVNQLPRQQAACLPPTNMGDAIRAELKVTPRSDEVAAHVTST